MTDTSSGPIDPGQDIVVTPVVVPAPDPIPTTGEPDHREHGEQHGRDEVLTPPTGVGIMSIGHVHRGWKTNLWQNLVIALLIAILAGTLAGTHYGAKAASQHTNSELVQKVAAQQGEILKLTVASQQTAVAVQSELAILKDATVPGGMLYEAGQQNTAKVIGIVVACLQKVVTDPTAPLPAMCTVA